MSLTKRRLEEQRYFDEPVETRKCPKCGEEMQKQPLDYSEMTDGQQADYDVGFNTPFECSECGYHDLFNVESVYEKEERELAWKDPEIDELVKIIDTSPKNFEDLIEHALRNKCFIEAISLIHNTIEAYLKKKIEDLKGNDEGRLELLKTKFKLKYLRDYNTIAYLLNIIEKSLYDSIIEFNSKRNKVIHDLIKRPKDLEQIRKIARKGREIQMRLSP